MNTHVRHAIILVGGRGTRLQPLTDTRPKPILPIAGKPFLAYQLAHLSRHGIEEVTFACGFMPQEIVAMFGEGHDVGMKLNYVREPEPLGTGGAIAFAARSITTPQPVVVCNGDILTQLDLTELIAMHTDKRARATIALTPVDDPSRYGLVRIGEDNAVQAFLEKPKPEEIDTNLINAGTYVIEPDVLSAISPDEPCSVERDVFPKLVGAGLYAMAGSGYWRDIGTVDSYLAANTDVLRGRIEDETGVVRSTSVISGDATISPDATIHNPVHIAAHAHVGSGANVGPDVVIDESVEVGDGARVANSVILEGAVVGREAQVTDSVVGEDAEICAQCAVTDGGVVGPGETIRNGIQRGDQPSGSVHT